jgi:FAD-dependent halogenase
VPDEQFDLIVIGGGPGGSTVSTLVAMAGHKVLLLEREQHPRYQVGESTLPYTLGISKILGVDRQLAEAGFTKKLGGEWRWGTKGTVVGVDFRDVIPQPLIDDAYAYQVERSRFDAILFANARRKGVDARENHRVEELIEANGRVVGAHYLDAHGRRGVARATHVVDAGGHSSPFHRLCGDRVFSERFRSFALFCYFKGGRRLPAPMSGSILNVTFPLGWFWYIPLSDTLTSVGAVVPIAHAALLSGGHEAAMHRFIDACPAIKEFLTRTERVTEGTYGQIRIRKDWSYLNTRFWRAGLILIGDAACFIDPLFSTGVHLATYSGLLAARSINTLLAGASDEQIYFDEFEERYRREYAKFHQFLSAFYQENQDKEDYFRSAQDILRTDEADYKAFVRLVSGWSSTGGHEAGVTHAGPPRTLSEKSFGGAFAESESDILGLAIGGERRPIAHAGLVPTSDGLAWQTRPAAADPQSS